MTELFHQLQQQISSSCTLENLELKEYALFVCQQIPRIKKSYAQNLQRHLCAWMQMIAESIKSTVNSKQGNQIGPKLELIYTTVINQQQTVNQYIKDIAQLIQKQNYCFHIQKDSSSSNKGLKYTQTTNSNKKNQIVCKNSQSDSYYNSRQQTIIKTRSISNGSQRRRLSKGSCFAEAKKINHQTDNFAQTGVSIQTFLKQSTGQNIKKIKKKEENGFAYLQKCMSNTSPSNFMLGYMAKADYRRECRQSRSSIDSKCKQPIVITDKVVEDGKKLQRVRLSSEGQCRNDSGTYEKMMVSFEENIGHKLDELMSKYSKIQQKLQEQSLQSTNKNTKNQPLYSLALNSPQSELKEPLNQNNQDAELNTHEPRNCSEAITLQNEVTAVEREVKKLSKDQQKDKEVSRSKTTAPHPNKSIICKNKIVRNTVQQTVEQEDSIESITLPTTSLKTLHLHDPKNKHPIMITLANDQLLQSKIVSKALADTSSQPIDQQSIKQVKDDHEYIVKQIVEFNKTTLKVILPISKKMLYIIKNKYSAFCNQHSLEMKAQVTNIVSEEVKNQAAELKDSLEKMEKILQLKCNEQKKKKLLLYLCSFLQCYQSFSDQHTVLRHSGDALGEETARSKIKEMISKLN